MSKPTAEPMPVWYVVLAENPAATAELREAALAAVRYVDELRRENRQLIRTLDHEVACPQCGTTIRARQTR